MNEIDYTKTRLDLTAQMIEKTRPMYVPTRKDLTDLMIEKMKQGYICFRVRTLCKCRPAKINPDHLIRYWRSNQYNGLIIIKGNKVKKLVVKCKECAKNAEKQKCTFRRFFEKNINIVNCILKKCIFATPKCNNNESCKNYKKSYSRPFWVAIPETVAAFYCNAGTPQKRGFFINS